jgi:3-oxoacyl-[acyl-carrier-protein] synthase-1
MSASALAISSVGMVTAVGLDAPTSCAAIRGAVDNFQETKFRDTKGQWLLGSEVPLPKPWRGAAKLLKMAARSVTECFERDGQIVPAATPLLVCLAEPDRPGRSVDDDRAFLSNLAEELGLPVHRDSRVISHGHVSSAVAIHHARGLLGARKATHAVVVATDTLLAGGSLRHFERRHRLLTSVNSDGFIPGDAAAAFALTHPEGMPGHRLICRGIGFGVERAHIDSEEPLRADALTSAINDALRDADCHESVLKFKIVDASGNQYSFKETSLAFSRIDRTKRAEFDVWHPADCVGEVGSAIGAVMVGVLKVAFEKGYAKGDHVLMHLGNDDGRRAALILSWQSN